MAAKKSSGPVEIKSLSLKTVEIPIIGTTPLIVHKWSEKAKRQMLDKQMKNTKIKKEPKVPEEDYASSMHRFEDGRHGFPAGGFKAAIVGAARLFDGLPMTHLKIAVRVEADGPEGLVVIQGIPRMREDTVRLETGTADIRFRAEYPTWSAILRITFVENMISLDQLVNLVNGAGMVGVGEWRPSAPKSASGSYGCFRVVAAGDA